MNIYFTEGLNNNDATPKSSKEVSIARFFVERMTDVEKRVLCKVGDTICLNEMQLGSEEEYCALSKLACCSMVDRKWAANGWCTDTHGYSLTERGIEAVKIILGEMCL